jgi:hypothetical protein
MRQHGEARTARAGGTGRSEAVTVVRRWRAGGRAARAGRGATAPNGRPRGAGGRSTTGRFQPSHGEQWASGLLVQASMLKGAEQEEWREGCRRCECR